MNKKLRKRLHQDLKLFKYAISIKDNKNNVYDTYSNYLMKKSGFVGEDYIYKSWEKHVEKIKTGEAPDLLSFYIHVPYCHSNCTYCCYPSTEIKDMKKVEEYLDFLLKQFEKFSPIFKGLEFKTLYIGGGTPSIFSEEQLNRLLTVLFEKFSFNKFGEFSIELNPVSTTFEKLKILERFGFNKISIGVQSLSPRVLKIANRSYQTIDMVKEVVDNFKKLDLNFLNADLLLGLKGDTVEDFKYSFEQLCKIRAPHIVIYPVKTNDEYIQKHYGTFEEFEKFYYPLFEGVAKELLPIAQKYDYNPHYELDKLSFVAPLMFSVKERQPGKRVDYSYTHFNLYPYSNFCLGYYAHSRIVDKMDYLLVDKNHPGSMFLKNFSTEPEDYTYMIEKLSKRFERVKFIIKEFYKEWEVSRVDYYELYNSDIVEDFSYAIVALTYFGIITVTPEKIIFKKTDEKELYPYLLFFTGEKNVYDKVKHCLPKNFFDVE